MLGLFARLSLPYCFGAKQRNFSDRICPLPHSRRITVACCAIKRKIRSLGAPILQWYYGAVMTIQRHTTPPDSRRPSRASSARTVAASVRLIDGETQAAGAIAEVGWQDVLIASNSATLLALARAGCGSRRQVGTLLIPFLPAVELLAALGRCFRRVIYLAAESRWCTDQVLCQLVKQADRQIALGFVFDSPSRLLTLVCADLSILTVPLSELSAALDHNAQIRPALSDQGRTIVLPDGSHPLLETIEKYDDTFRRARRRGLWAQSAHPGERIRHLRLARCLRREDIPGVDLKTIARIERGEIRTPQKETLRLIAAALQIPLSELQSHVPPRRHNRRKADSSPGPHA